MTSQVGVRVSPPTWGARPAPGPPAEAHGPPARRALAPLELRGPSAFPSEAVAGAALLALWVLLWAVFTVGVVEPATALGRAPVAEVIEARSAPGDLPRSPGPIE
jgi:hypothetical protein